MADRIITREVLSDWIANDGLEHLFEEGYLDPDQVDPEDTELAVLVTTAHDLYRGYEKVAQKIHDLVDGEFP